MTDPGDRVQEALAAHLEHAELGGAEPDVSHLSAEEREELQRLIGLLEQTEGVAFGRGREGAGDEVSTSSETAERLVATLRDVLPAGSRISDDPAATTIEGPDVAEGWIVGTFGGRARVWLLAEPGALEAGDDWLRGLEHVFRLFPDTAAIALVEPDLSCLLVQPEDCAPTIEVPRGSLVGRHYRRPVGEVGDVLPAFMRELTPYWEPMQDIGDHASHPIDLPPIVREQAAQAIESQIAAGRRARKTNPKRKALTELGEEEAGRLAELLLDVREGRAELDDVEAELRRLAANP